MSTLSEPWLAYFIDGPARSSMPLALPEGPPPVYHVPIARPMPYYVREGLGDPKDLTHEFLSVDYVVAFRSDERRVVVYSVEER